MIEIICIPSSMLNSNLYENIKSELIRTRVGKSFKELGLIKRLVSFKIIIGEINIGDSNNEFTVETNYESFKPEIGNIYTAYIAKIHTNGILANIERNNIYALILNDDTDNSRKLNIGTSVKIILNEIIFKTGQFSALASFV